LIRFREMPFFNRTKHLRMNPFRNIALLASLVLFTLPALRAQIKSDEVDIIKQFNARLADANRVLLSPKLPPADTGKNTQQYNIVNRALNVQYLAPRISPKSLREEPRDPIYKGYARLGAGLPKALLFEGGYDLSSNENLDLGFDVRHLSMNNTGKVENKAFPIAILAPTPPSMPSRASVSPPRQITAGTSCTSTAITSCLAS
jgi:hypothetical protein